MSQLRNYSFLILVCSSFILNGCNQSTIEVSHPPAISSAPASTSSNLGNQSTPPPPIARTTPPPSVINLDELDVSQLNTLSEESILEEVPDPVRSALDSLTHTLRRSQSFRKSLSPRGSSLNLSTLRLSQRQRLPSLTRTKSFIEASPIIIRDASGISIDHEGNIHLDPLANRTSQVEVAKSWIQDWPTLTPAPTEESIKSQAIAQLKDFVSNFEPNEQPPEIKTVSYYDFLVDREVFLNALRTFQKRSRFHMFENTSLTNKREINWDKDRLWHVVAEKMAWQVLTRFKKWEIDRRERSSFARGEGGSKATRKKLLDFAISVRQKELREFKKVLKDYLQAYGIAPVYLEKTDTSSTKEWIKLGAVHSEFQTFSLTNQVSYDESQQTLNISGIFLPARNLEEEMHDLKEMERVINEMIEEMNTPPEIQSTDETEPQEILPSLKEQTEVETDSPPQSPTGTVVINQPTQENETHQ